MINMTFAGCLLAAVFSVSSPDGHLQALVSTDDGALTYRIEKKGETIVAPSQIDFKLKDADGKVSVFPLKEAVQACDDGKIARRSGSEKWNCVVKNRHAAVDIPWNELELELGHVKTTFRAMDDGIAFRSTVMAEGRYALQQEETSFQVPNDATAWVAQFARNYTSSQEGKFHPMSVADVSSQMVCGMPFLMRYRPDLWVMIAEANINDYPGFYIGSARGRRFSRAGCQPLVTKLSPRHDDPQNESHLKWTDDAGKATFTTSWRVVMVAERPGRFMETEVIKSLNPPCAIPDATDWIKPGLCAWDRWWSLDGKAKYEDLLPYIDFAAKEGWPYQLIDWGWYGVLNKPEADITKPIYDVPGLCRYAAEKGVKCWLWIHSNDVARNDAYKTAFPIYANWGVAGVKIDFMDRDDQEMVNWYRAIVKCAADNHLMVDFHGAYKPDGIERTYPNLLTREGVLGSEYHKDDWAFTFPTPEHNTTLPFTRMAQGPMDYTPGGFINVTRKNFSRTLPAQVDNTRAAELAKFVIFESPLQVFCDHPTNVIGQVGEDFLVRLPSEWDDTRCLAGTPGESVLVARQNGKRWYVGALTNDDARDFVLDTSSFAPNATKVTLWRDSADAAEEPTHCTVETLAPGRLTIRAVTAGGFAAVVE